MRVCPNCQTQYPGDDPFCSKDGRETVKAEAESSDSLPLIGTQVGNYQITSLLGEGGMGMVYRAEHPALGRVVAIKVLHEEFARRSDGVERFFTEARAVNQIRHENIVDVIDFGFLPGQRPYFVMEYLEGVDLSHYLKEKKKLPVEEAAEIMVPVLSALQAAHDEGIIHRDLKPENIFLVERKHGGRTAKLLDFGIAKLLAAKETVYKTRTGAMIGTPAYMSPEQASGQSDLDPRADIYAAGIILYEMLVGEPPFTGKTILEIVHKQWMEKPLPPKQRRPELSEKINYLILRALEKKPERRIQTAAEFARRLADALPRRLSASLLPSPGQGAGSWKGELPARPPVKPAPVEPPPLPEREEDITTQTSNTEVPAQLLQPTPPPAPVRVAPPPPAPAGDRPAWGKIPSLLLEEELEEPPGGKAGGQESAGGPEPRNPRGTPSLPPPRGAVVRPAALPEEVFQEEPVPSAFRTTLSGSTGEVSLEELRKITAPPRWVWGAGVAVVASLLLGLLLLFFPRSAPSPAPTTAAGRPGEKELKAPPAAPLEPTASRPATQSTPRYTIPPPEPGSSPTEKPGASKTTGGSKGSEKPGDLKKPKDPPGPGVETLIPPVVK